MADYKKRSDTLTKKEQDTVKDMKIVQEMYARGFCVYGRWIFIRHRRTASRLSTVS